MPRIRVPAPPDALWEEVNAIDRAREEAARREEESRKILLAEREHIQMRLDEIDRMLSVLDRKPTIATTPQELAKIGPPKSAPALIREILQLNPDGLTTSEIEKRMGVVGDKASWSLHTALHRMSKTGDVTFTGKRGERVYRLAAGKDSGKDETTKGE